MENELQACVLYILREIFPAFQKWRYYNSTRREVLGKIVEEGKNNKNALQMSNFPLVLLQKPLVRVIFTNGMLCPDSINKFRPHAMVAV